MGGIMSAEDYVGYAERKRTLKRRSADWRAVTINAIIISSGSDAGEAGIITERGSR